MVPDYHAPGAQCRTTPGALAVIADLEHWDWAVRRVRRWRSALWVAPGAVEREPAGFSRFAATATTRTELRPHLPSSPLGQGRHQPTLALDKAIADHYPFLIQEGQRPTRSSSRTASRRATSTAGMSEDEERNSISATRSRRSTVGLDPPAPGRWPPEYFEEMLHLLDLLAVEGIRDVCDLVHDG